jgi:hypothetical protein
MGSLKNALLRLKRLFWMPRQKYAYLCRRSGFYTNI